MIWRPPLPVPVSWPEIVVVWPKSTGFGVAVSVTPSGCFLVLNVRSLPVPLPAVPPSEGPCDASVLPDRCSVCWRQHARRPRVAVLGSRNPLRRIVGRLQRGIQQRAQRRHAGGQARGAVVRDGVQDELVRG